MANVPNELQLCELVKYCILDAAIINGLSPEDCLGSVSEKVTYNSVSIVVDTEITPSDIEDFYEKKASMSQYA